MNLGIKLIAISLLISTGVCYSDFKPSKREELVALFEGCSDIYELSRKGNFNKHKNRYGKLLQLRLKVQMNNPDMEINMNYVKTVKENMVSNYWSSKDKSLMECNELVDALAKAL
jgi:hypothetical protein